MSKPGNGTRLGSLFGRQPIYIPGHGNPGDLSIGATPDGPFGEKLMTPNDGTPWHDGVAARSLLSFSWRRPVRRAAFVRVPLLLVVSEADGIAPPRSKSPARHRGPNCSAAPAATTTSTKAEQASPTCCERRATSSIATPRPQPKSCPERPPRIPKSPSLAPPCSSCCAICRDSEKNSRGSGVLPSGGRSGLSDQAADLRHRRVQCGQSDAHARHAFPRCERSLRDGGKKHDCYQAPAQAEGREAERRRIEEGPNAQPANPTVARSWTIRVKRLSLAENAGIRRFQTPFTREGRMFNPCPAHQIASIHEFPIIQG
jgi:hypothetical protein